MFNIWTLPKSVFGLHGNCVIELRNGYRSIEVSPFYISSQILSIAESFLSLTF